MGSMDCSAEDREAGLDEGVRLVARVIARGSDSHGAWLVLADPEGNAFCV
ncbi:MAG: hypothetical protein HY829_08975 [Actinobacteria bacterium]|nr:hypothetical protein [Actinomycetota bacterium]